MSQIFLLHMRKYIHRKIAANTSASSFVIACMEWSMWHVDTHAQLIEYMIVNSFTECINVNTAHCASNAYWEKYESAAHCCSKCEHAFRSWRVHFFAPFHSYCTCMYEWSCKTTVKQGLNFEMFHDRLDNYRDYLTPFSEEVVNN